MHRYYLRTKSPFIDSTSAEAALKQALQDKTWWIEEQEIPKKAILMCSVTPTPNIAGTYSAAARLAKPDGSMEVIATVDAPSPDRALRALGYQNPQAHTCKIYKRRFGDLFELQLAPKAP